jgi:kynurenine formamidase
MSEATTQTLPQKELGKRLSNWGRWGADDEIGTLNFITPEKRIQAGRMIKTGKVFDLGMPFDSSGPQGGVYRINPVHTMTRTPLDSRHSPDGVITADDMVTMGLQCGTQWDSLAHVGYDGFFYNHMPAHDVTTFDGATRNSFAKCVDRLISRGVLLDIARLKGVDRLADSTEIVADDLTDAAERQGVEVGSGDILLVRTGSYQWFLEGDNARFNMSPEPGLGLSCAEWLYEREVAAVALDNWACEVWPSKVEGSRIPFHMVAIRDIGLTIGEMFNFEELAADCAEDGIYEFMFSGTGLKITGAVGSPVTPMALK